MAAQTIGLFRAKSIHSRHLTHTISTLLNQIYSTSVQLFLKYVYKVSISNSYLYAIQILEI